MSIQAVAIFCGSKSGTNELYKREAETLGRLLASQNIRLIYGGGKNGLMGYVADAAMQAGGTVRGIITKQLGDWEVGHQALSELTVVDSMHERKRQMYELCDAAVILPGGFGTLDELFEILTWNQLSLHHKKVFVLNSAGFYNHLLQHMRQLSNEGFLYGDITDQLIVLDTAEQFEKHLVF
ncbi:MAG TPA: TIGR00730 family Rossman fold protein [Niastella sp.]|nr:TIGR00730 family Rossman fold protein [Niastella sp.]